MINTNVTSLNPNIKKIVKITSISIFFIILVIYGTLRSRDLIFGVQIRNVNIVDGEKFTDNILKLEGNAKNATILTLNGRDISVDQEGNFRETVALLSGYNLINITARDKFGHEDEKNYQVIY